jgi:hypothetical protein
MRQGAGAASGGGQGSAGIGQGSQGSYRPVELQPGQYLYMRQTLTHKGETFSTETWWALDGSGRQRITCSTQDCVMDKAPDGSYSDSYGSAGDRTFGTGQYPIDDDLSGLSTDPATLQQQMLARTAPGGNSPEPAFSPGPELTPGVTAGGLLDAILNVVQEPNGQPDVKAAAFQVAMGIPGVQVRTGGTDGAGRPATVLEFGLDGGAVTDYYFDPDTGLLMGYAFEGSSDTIVYDQAIVDSTDAMPDASQWLFPPAP